MLEKTYICNAYGIHPIMCVWGLTFRKETVESPSFFYTLSSNTTTINLFTGSGSVLKPEGFLQYVKRHANPIKLSCL